MKTAAATVDNETVYPCEDGQYLIEGIRENASVEITGTYLSYVDQFERHKNDCPRCAYSMYQAREMLEQ